MVKDGRVLLLKAAPHELWDQWAPNWKIYTPERAAEDTKRWRFPSAYIKEGEAPEDALARVMKEQLGIENYQVESSTLENFYNPSGRYPGKMHWDYCFVYRVRTSENPRKQDWLAHVEYLDLKGLTEEEFGSAQGDLARRLGLL